MHIRSLLAGACLAATVVALPVAAISIANADDGGSATPSTATCPRAEVHQEIADYLAAHPDVAAEIATIRALPADQRADARSSYLADHPDVAAALDTLHGDRRGVRWEIAGNVAAQIQAHPELDGLVDALATAPAGQRQQAARQYLEDHPEAADALSAVRSDVRQHRQDCRAGG